jgi:Protein of unknown function (DUF3604)
MRCLIGVMLPMVLVATVGHAAEPATPARHAYFGAVHIHTSYSFDAFANGSRTTPDDAYAWAQGKPIAGGGGGGQLQIKTPLDFYAVSDHAEFLGVFRLMADPSSPLSKLPIAQRITSPDQNVALQAFAEVLRNFSEGQRDPRLSDPAISKSVWSKVVAAADAAYKPGSFTTFPAFEWTSNPNKRNLHRVVVFAAAQHVPALPLSALDTDKPEALWQWMDALRADGAVLLAIPHNGNASDGLMFSNLDSEGQPISDAYIEQRALNEPLYEISQIKGTSETTPALSPTDEFAGFELWNYTLSADAERPTREYGSYARPALLEGIAFAAQGRSNPFKFGFIGDSDTHNAAASNEEFNYSGKFAFENDPSHRLNGLPGQPPAQEQQVREFSSGGLAGVWADANTRAAIFAAMQRKETFGTSGPHIRVRLFGGWDFMPRDLAATDPAAVGYARGVPMGADLPVAAGAGRAPSFMVWAVKDPQSGNLDRIQIVKGWVDAHGAQRQRIYDVVWSGDRKPDPAGRVPSVGNTVDASRATYSNSIGARELSVVWTDPDFDPALQAFYYARVIEIPTPRWSTYDAVKLGIPIPGGLPATIQERAWTSPIWYAPKLGAAEG